MTLLQIATLALYGVTGVVAVAVGKKDKRNTPVACYLVTVVAIEIVYRGLHRLLPPTPPAGPVEGLVLIARHAHQTLQLGGILLLPAMNMALFLRRRPWIIGVVYLALSAVFIASYPGLRGHELVRIYTGIELAGIVASAGFFIMWLRSPRFLEESRSVPIMSAVALTAATLATVVLPKLTGNDLLTDWQIVVATNAIGLACVLVFQLRYLLAGKERI